jgi:hypothetical protein
MNDIRGLRASAKDKLFDLLPEPLRDPAPFG